MHQTAVYPPPSQLLRFEPRAEAVATVDIVIPVYNEEAGLEASVRRLHRYLCDRFPFTWSITIADNASTDRTWPLACALAQGLDGVRAVHLPAKGRGRALRTTWLSSRSAVLAYMDVDLSTNLDALLPLVAPLVSGHSDMAIGSRLAPAARVVRGAKREAISRGYNLLLKAALKASFSDAQCGFKAIRADAAQQLLPMVQDVGWFFDTELLVLAEHNGLRIHEVPVDWIDDPDSRVDVVSTAKADLRGVWRMRRDLAHGRGVAAVAAISGRATATPDFDRQRLVDRLVRFGSIGVVSTAAFAVLFVVLLGSLGLAGADVVALALCTLANTAANRRLTFELRGRNRLVRHHAAGLAVGLLPLGLNLMTLAVLSMAGVGSMGIVLGALTVTNAAAALVKFTLLNRWVFRRAS
ncbi:MAG: sugar translocase [Acidimicrobiia bacterium]|nr:sugar translocase [Acidimicrobiia bacterium]